MTGYAGDRETKRRGRGLAHYGLANRDPATQKTNRHLCESHVIPLLGARKLRDLTAPEVDAQSGATIMDRLFGQANSGA